MEALIGTGIAVVILIFAMGRVYGGRLHDEWEDAPRKMRTGPDMAFSAGRDPAHQNARMQQVFIPMAPEEEAALREFYLGTLGLTEMRSPNFPPEADGFWAVSGTRQIFVGAAPRFAVDAGIMPAFPMPKLDDMAHRLQNAGHTVQWDRRKAFITRLIVTDPAGTEIALIAA